MDSTTQHSIAHHGQPQPGHPPPGTTYLAYGSQQPIGQPYWAAAFTPSAPVSVAFKHQTGHGDPPGWGNNELQNYTADANNSFYRGDGKLVVRAVANSNRPPDFRYTSARLTSLQTLGRQRAAPWPSSLRHPAPRASGRPFGCCRGRNSPGQPRARSTSSRAGTATSSSTAACTGASSRPRTPPSTARSRRRCRPWRGPRATCTASRGTSRTTAAAGVWSGTSMGKLS